jgi:hypothetical protein
MAENQRQTRLDGNKLTIVSVVTDAKLVAETAVTKELEEHVYAVMKRQLHFGQSLSDLFGFDQ